MLGAFALGAAAGYAIAVPVGAIALLILRLGMRHGFRPAALAGAGAATADLLYAFVAVAVGAGLTAMLAPVLVPVRLAAAAILAAIAVRLVVARHATAEPASPVATYFGVLGLTLLNPTTVLYFATLALALPELAEGVAARAMFVAGAFLASLSWQTLLAAVAATLHARLSPRLERATSVLGGLIILALAFRIAVEALRLGSSS